MLTMVLPDVDVHTPEIEVSNKAVEVIKTLVNIQMLDKAGKSVEPMPKEQLEQLRNIDFENFDLQFVRSETGHIGIILQ